MDRCGGCGVTLLFSARQHGDSLCHSCAHDRLSVFRELVEQALSRSEPWENLPQYNVVLSREWIRKARNVTYEFEPPHIHSKDLFHTYIHQDTGLLIELKLVRTFVERLDLYGTVHRHEMQRDLVTASGQRIANVSCDDHDSLFPLVIHILAELGSVQRLVRYDR